MNKYTHWIQVPGIGAGLLGAVVLLMWPESKGAAYILFGIGLIFILGPFIRGLFADNSHPGASISEPDEPDNPITSAGETSSDHDVYIADACHYIVTRDWNAPKIDYERDRTIEADKVTDALITVHQKAAAGDLVIYGKTERDSPLVPIPTEYWQDNSLDPLGCFIQNPEYFRTVSKTPGRIGGTVYHTLFTSKSRIEDLFSGPA